MTSVSLLVRKMDPQFTRSFLRTRSLTRFPLWHTAISPNLQSMSSGWALTAELSPAVE